MNVDNKFNNCMDMLFDEVMDDLKKPLADAKDKPTVDLRFAKLVMAYTLINLLSKNMVKTDDFLKLARIRDDEFEV